MISDWLRSVRASCDMEVSHSRLADSRDWALVDGTVRHRTGGFFSVVGVQVDPDPDRGLPGLVQPIIDQPEVGLLGFVVHDGGDGVEVLVQAKPEPGNVGIAQIAPTVQATRSNYLRVHGGRPTVLLDAFGRDAPGDVRVPQSEQGSRFLGKYNENALTRLDERIPEPGDEFRWFGIDDLLAALGDDFAVNTDARSVLVTAGATALVRHRTPFDRPAAGPFGELLAASYVAGRAAPRPVDDALRSLEVARDRWRFAGRVVPLERCGPWSLDGGGGTDTVTDDGYGFVHVAVHTTQREVEVWDQPLATAGADGDSVLVGQWSGDRLRFLFACTPEVGFRESVQVHPTVQRTPGPGLAGADVVRRDRVLADVAAEAVVQRSARQSDEGGRFDRCVGRYAVALLAESTEVGDPDGTVWLSLDQIEVLARRTGFFTNEARSVLSLLLGLA